MSNVWAFNALANQRCLTKDFGHVNVKVDRRSSFRPFWRGRLTRQTFNFLVSVKKLSINLREKQQCVLLKLPNIKASLILFRPDHFSVERYSNLC